MRRAGGLLLAAAVAAGALAACSGGDDGDARPTSGTVPAGADPTVAVPDEPAQAAAVRQATLLTQRAYDQVYDVLHPAQRARFGSIDFGACLRGRGTAFDGATSTVAVSEAAQHLTVDGTAVEADATAVTLRVEGGGAAREVVLREVAVDGRWRLVAPEAADLLADRC